MKAKHHKKRQLHNRLAAANSLVKPSKRHWEQELP